MGEVRKRLQFHVLGYEEFSLVQVQKWVSVNTWEKFQVSERGGGENWCEV